MVTTVDEVVSPPERSRRVLSFAHAADDQLVSDMPKFARNERVAGATFIACLGEFDGRKLYLGLGFCSIYSYCAKRLHLTEGCAYRASNPRDSLADFPSCSKC